MQHLFEDWSNVANQLKSAEQILFMCDFDGTLTPIVDRPEMADLNQEVRKLLSKLSRCRRITVAVISGRSLNDLRTRIAIPSLIYAGNHGLEIVGPHYSYMHPVTNEIKKVLNIIHGVLLSSLGKIKGVIVEDKNLTLSVHYRLVDEDDVSQVASIFKNTLAGAENLGKIKTTEGKKVYEVRPAVSWHKGKAVKLIMKNLGKGGWYSGTLPVYLGDDLTDEDAFKVMENYGGIAVYVGQPVPESAASYFLKDTYEVENLLRSVLAIC